MFGFGMPELIVVLVIVLVVFGAGRLPEIGGALGKHQEFQESLQRQGGDRDQALSSRR